MDRGMNVDPLTRKPKYVRETRKTRGEAEKELTRRQRDIDLDRHTKSAITVAEAIDQWMEVAGGRSCPPVR
jgi:hypothetical protein